MGIIRKTGTRQTRYTANYWCPYRSELVVSEKSIPSEDPPLRRPSQIPMNPTSSRSAAQTPRSGTFKQDVLMNDQAKS